MRPAFLALRSLGGEPLRRLPTSGAADVSNSSSRPLAPSACRAVVPIRWGHCSKERTQREFEANFRKLDREHQIEVEDAIRDFAAHAVGDENWDQ